MSDYLIKEERTLLAILKSVLNNEDLSDKEFEGIDWNEFFSIAEKHAVLSLLYDSLQIVKIPDTLKEYLKTISIRTVQQSYRLAFLTRELVEMFQQKDIFCVALKGVCASVGYPVPELRKSGDVDLLIEPEKINEAEKLLEARNFRKSEEQHANHHVAYYSPEGIEVELHTMITEPFDNGAVNAFLEKLVSECRKHCLVKDVMGIHIKTLDDAYFAYQLLLHMLQHFLRAGFGLKLLCDWVTFWNGEISHESKKEYLRLINASKLKGFSDVITSVCVRELGLDGRKVSFMFGEEHMPSGKVTREFIREILEAEEFGNSTNDRMVMMRGTKPVDYIREFHHQMQLNYPKASRFFVLWPFTWTVTLIRFIINNKRIRNTSTMGVLKKAHARSKLMKNIALFQ